MMCPKCGHDNRTGAKFCEQCGTALAPVCTHCGARISPTAKFCSECGLPSSPETASASSPSRFGAPEDYTPAHLAERILTSRVALEGERKLVTALFADVRGSMELFADRDPEEARRLLDPVIERMMEAVHRYEGTVNHVLGDGIVALFGAPLAHEDHAVRACYAALRIQQSVKQYAGSVCGNVWPPIQVRVGLSSGELVVRSVSSDLRMDYTAVGQTANVAARMEQIAAPGSILISAETMRLAEGYVEARPLGPLKVKGLENSVETYELTGARRVRSRLDATAARGLTRFVGRDREFDLLCQALERAGTGHGQIVAVVGEPGVGKSRLFWEFTRAPCTDGWLIVESGSVSYGKATAFLPILSMLRDYFHIQVGDEAKEITEKVRGKLLSLDQALEPSLPVLLWLLDVQVDDPHWQRLDPPQRRQRALDAVKRLLLRESLLQPVLVVFEDLHWIDAESQALLDSLVESLPAARLLLLVNYRPEYRHAWSGKTYYRQLSVEPLSPESAEALLAALLGNDTALQPLKRLLIERTEGNPFFLEEIVRTLVGSGVLTGERGAFRLVEAVRDLDIPVTAQAVLAARIDRLSSEDKRLLQAASVIGKDVPFALLQHIAELPEEDLQQGLANLQAAEFLYESRMFPDLEYTFKHALTHDVTYGSLLLDRRRTLHCRVVEAIEQLFVERLAEHIEQLAYHALRGEIWDKAASYLRQAGAKAFARSANGEAAGYFEQALLALSHLPDMPETLEQGVDVRLSLRNALWPLGRFGSGFSHLEDAERLATKLGDERRLGWIAAYMSEHTRQTGHAGDAPKFAERALRIAGGLDDLQLWVAANYYLGTACFVAGDYQRTDEFFEAILDVLKGERFRERCGLAGFPAVMSRMFWPLALVERGEFTRAMVEAKEGVRLAEALDHPYSLICAMRAVGRVHGAKGEVTEAIPIVEQSLALARVRNLPQLFPEVADLLGQLYGLSGRATEGISLLEEALAALEAMAMFQWRSSVLVHLGETYLLADRPQDAYAVAELGLTLTRERGHRGYEAWSHYLLGKIASHAARPAVTSAELHYRAALARASELGMRPLVAHCHACLGQLLQSAGDRTAAEEHLATATTMYRDMEMRLVAG
jgi:class 3 adenylate cyclase/tetratricopeptide (TPR) repeat protein